MESNINKQKFTSINLLGKMKNTYKYWVYKANVSLQNESGYIYGGESQVILINAQVRWTKAITNGE